MASHVTHGVLPRFKFNTPHLLTMRIRNIKPDVAATVSIDDSSGRSNWTDIGTPKVKDSRTVEVMATPKKATMLKGKPKTKGGSIGPRLTGAGEGDLTITVTQNAIDSTSSQDVWYED
jgi:hypothetical protein